MIAPKYDHKAVEEGRYQIWKDQGYFKSKDTNKPPFTIVIPPPNVTGKLHLGHAWDNTIQDILIRMKRMQGYDALYLPGMDHAGIATQAKIDAKLREEGKSRYDLGREGFLKEAWAWKEEYASTIRAQWEALGISVDYDKERFTLDDGLSQAVETVFVKLYEKGLIYRKERIINWDVEAKTALSNIEVERKDIEGALYYLRYLTADESDEILIATTRPETMFADTALIIHPEDEARQHFVGQKVKIPGTDVLIPVLADDYVDREFGTGALKVTPAHDPNDFEIGERHGLAMPSCMNDDGTMNAMAHQYEGMERFACRKAMVKDLEAAGLLTKIEKITHNVGHSERTGVVVEPRLSLQWFVDMKTLAENALKNSTAQFVPARFEKIFTHWMETIQDWCISRQLWWGHRIPAYYKGDDVYVGPNPPEGYVQDTDVLDTWFSSALWPFSTLGWPENTDDFKRYYPTDVMVTGYDIIFFWVARMIFQAIEFTGETPFKDVLIHGLIRDASGQKMSKSLGNGIDPLDIKEKYGMDTLRYFLTTNSAPGLDLRFEFEKVESSWNYINKLWNMSRYAMMQMEDLEALVDLSAPKALPNQMILAAFEVMLKNVNEAYGRYELSEAARAIYTFSWDTFASWYIEMSKPLMRHSNDEIKHETLTTMWTVLTKLLKLLHPFMPFVTEYLYLHLPFVTDASIMISAWPEAAPHLNNESALRDFSIIQDLVLFVRQTRSHYNVGPKKPIDVYLETSHERVFTENFKIIEEFIHPKLFSFNNDYTPNPEDITHVGAGFTVYIPLGSLVDITEEIAKQEAELDRIEGEIKRAEGMLANPRFMEKAPAHKVEEERAKKAAFEAQKEALEKLLNQLKSNV